MSNERWRAAEHEIYREPIAPGAHPDVVRTAVRAVALRGGELLMVYSPVNGDYKFPGGGVEAGESHEDTLRREVREETGLTVRRVSRRIARIREYGPATEPDARVFMMESHYYLAEVDDAPRGRQALDEYEERLGFTPRWVSPEEAVTANEAVLAGATGGAGSTNGRGIPRWTERETWVLRHVMCRFST